MWRRSQTDPDLAAIEIVYREQPASFVRLAFVRAVRYRGRLRDRESAPGWVCRIVLNEARKRSTAERRQVSTSLETEHEPATNGRREPGAAAAALASLPERQRLALFLRYYADLEPRVRVDRGRAARRDLASREPGGEPDDARRRSRLRAAPGTALVAGSQALVSSNGLVVAIHAPDEAMAIDVARLLEPHAG